MKISTLLGKALLIASLVLGSSWAFAAPVNVNTADAVTLAKNINGVGAKKAQAIVKYRNLNGPFKSVDELLNVKGIGQKIIEKNRGDLLVTAATPAKAKNSK